MWLSCDHHVTIMWLHVIVIIMWPSCDHHVITCDCDYHVTIMWPSCDYMWLWSSCDHHVTCLLPSSWACQWESRVLCPVTDSLNDCSVLQQNAHSHGVPCTGRQDEWCAACGGGGSSDMSTAVTSPNNNTHWLTRLTGTSASQRHIHVHICIHTCLNSPEWL